MNSMILLIAAMGLLAQVPQAPQAAPDKLTATEVIAVNQVASELTKASQDAGNVIADIQRAHPGYTFDFRTGQLNKVVPVKKPDLQPRTETRTKTAPENPVPAPKK